MKHNNAQGLSDKIPVLYESHEGGGSVWVQIGLGQEYYICVWSTSTGNVGAMSSAAPSESARQSLHVPYT